jgi:CRISPR/Cas system CSM-associated protein Csm2 small subunit
MKKIKKKVSIIKPKEDNVVNSVLFEDKLEKVNIMREKGRRQSEKIRELDKVFSDKIKELKEAIGRVEKLEQLLSV